MSENLSEFFIEKAKKELREDEGRKQQSVELIKDWVFKHPYIKILNEECLSLKNLLPFLRNKKYSMDKVYESIEKSLIFFKTHKNWTDFSPENLKRALMIYETGNIIVTKERDSEGRRAVIFTYRGSDLDFTSDEAFLLYDLVLATLLYEEESQISGINIISDPQGISMSYVSRFSLKDFYEFAVASKALPFRLKNILVVGMPVVISQIMNIGKSALSEKVQKRFQVLKSNTELANYMDVKILPKEYGGNYTVEELVDDFRPKMMETAEYLVDFFSKIDIDLTKALNYKEKEGLEMSGSFRKLEID